MQAALYYAEGTHLTTDVINSHMNKDGCLFYTFQVHVSVTWNRVNKADKELKQMIGRASTDFPFVNSRRNESLFSQLLPAISTQAGTSPSHTQLSKSHTTYKLNCHFFLSPSIYKKAVVFFPVSIIAAVDPWLQLDYILSWGLTVHY